MKYLQIILDFFLIPFSPRVDLHGDPFLQQEEAWYKTGFKPKPSAEANYDAALQYAEQHYKEVKESFASLDKKAQWFYGVSIAAITLVYLISPEKTFSTLFTWGLPSLALSALAFWSLVRAIKPGDLPARMSIRGAIECAESMDTANAIISANLHCATQQIAKVNTWKARQISFASGALVGAFLLAPLVLFAQHAPAVTSSVVVDIPLGKPASTGAVLALPVAAPQAVLRVQEPLPASLELRGRLELQVEQPH